MRLQGIDVARDGDAPYVVELTGRQILDIAELIRSVRRADQEWGPIPDQFADDLQDLVDLLPKEVSEADEDAWMRDRAPVWKQIHQHVFEIYCDGGR